MKRKPRSLPWLYGGAVAVAVLFAVLALFRDPDRGFSSRGPRAPSIGLVRLGATPVDLSAQDALLFDPTPLFLPTDLDGARIEKKLEEPGSALSPFPPKLTFAESELALNLPSPVEIPSPAGSLTSEPPSTPFLGLGRSEEPIPKVPERSALIEICEAGTGHIVLRQAVQDAQIPAKGLWPPVEFLAAVDSAGLVGPLVRTPGGVIDDLGQASEEVDGYFRSYLVETLRVGQRLAPGLYRISVGP